VTCYIVLLEKRTFLFLVINGSPLLESINDDIRHKFKEGIYRQINKRDSDKAKVNSKFKSYNFAHMYHVISSRHLQNVICLLILGYVLYILYNIYIICFI
jgi:hypothetical protein